MPHSRIREHTQTHAIHFTSGSWSGNKCHSRHKNPETIWNNGYRPRRPPPAVLTTKSYRVYLPTHTHIHTHTDIDLSWTEVKVRLYGMVRTMTMTETLHVVGEVLAVRHVLTWSVQSEDWPSMFSHNNERRTTTDVNPDCISYTTQCTTCSRCNRT